MNLVIELEQKTNEDIILIDTSVINHHEDTSLTELLYDGLESLDILDENILFRRFERLNELTKIMQVHKTPIIPQVYTEVQYYLNILKEQQSYIEDEVRKSIQTKSREDISYCRSILDVINSYNLTLHRFLKKLKSNLSDKNLQQQEKYLHFMDSARKLSRDLERKAESAKDTMQNKVYLGKNLETDKHLVVTAFVLAYEHPVTLMTRDNGLCELVRRVYELLIHDRIPENTNAPKFSIPRKTINIFNPQRYDYRKVEESKPEFLW